MAPMEPNRIAFKVMVELLSQTCPLRTGGVPGRMGVPPAM